MLNKSLRLTKNKEFDQVFKLGHSFFGVFLGIKVMPNKKEKNRFGVLVGLKISKSAVFRNLIKRRIKSAIYQEESKLKSGYDVVVITRPEIATKKYQEIKAEIVKGFNKLRMYV